jgi:hypothetical protein
MFFLVQVDELLDLAAPAQVEARADEGAAEGEVALLPGLLERHEGLHHPAPEGVRVETRVRGLAQRCKGGEISAVDVDDGALRLRALATVVPLRSNAHDCPDVDPRREKGPSASTTGRHSRASERRFEAPWLLR